MAFKDLLLVTLTYPDPPPDRAMRSAVALARRLGGDLTVAPVRSHFPRMHNPIANALIGLDRMAEDAEHLSASRARHEALMTEIAAQFADVKLTHVDVDTMFGEERGPLSRMARTRDATIMSIGRNVLPDEGLAEDILFGSGRPVIVYPDALEISAAGGFERAAIAWDGSAPAARAVADALPVLKRANEVRVVVAMNEKPGAKAGPADDLIRHLKAHGVAAVLDEQPAAGVSIGHVLNAYANNHNLDLLVMGGFGHSRVREFILGGATASMLFEPPCPVLMSH